MLKQAVDLLKTGACWQRLRAPRVVSTRINLKPHACVDFPPPVLDPARGARPSCTPKPASHACGCPASRRLHACAPLAVRGDA